MVSSSLRGTALKSNAETDEVNMRQEVMNVVVISYPKVPCISLRSKRSRTNEYFLLIGRDENCGVGEQNELHRLSISVL